MTPTPDVHDLLSLAGETVLVTGASGNIGGGVGRRLAEAGAEIVVHFHRDKASATSLVDELGSGMIVQADLSDADAVDAMFAACRPTMVVNNAAAQAVQALDDMRFDDWRAVMSANRRCFSRDAVRSRVLEGRGWCRRQHRVDRGH